MRRALLITALAGACAAAAPAQDPYGIPWSLHVEDCIAQAKQTRKPLMFYVVEHRYCNVGELILNQQKAFRDPMVLELAARFIPVRLSRTRYGDLLESWNQSREAALQIVFVTPNGVRIDVLSPNGAAEPVSLTRKMALVYKHYRDVLFEKELRPVLENEEASVDMLARVMDLVKQFIIPSADQPVIDLFERESLAPLIANKAYNTLAVLSTDDSVLFLLDEAVETAAAAEALKLCTPGAAETMLSELESDNPYVQLAVYQAVTKICRVERVKPDRFWTGKNRYVLNKEIKRVKKIVKSNARRWRERYAEYR